MFRRGHKPVRMADVRGIGAGVLQMERVDQVIAVALRLFNRGCVYGGVSHLRDRYTESRASSPRG